MRTVATATALSCLLVAGARGQRGTTASASQDDFVLGVFEASAILPIATYVSGRWSNPWDVSYGKDGDPLPGLDAVPKEWLGQALPEQWSLRFSAGPVTTVRAKALERYGCEGPASLTTDYVAPPRGTIDSGHPGIVVAPDHPSLALRKIPIRGVPPAMLAAVRRDGERQGLASTRLRWLIQAGEPTDALYYYETRESKVPDAAEPRIIRGWIGHDDAGRWRIFGSAVTYCGNEEKATLPCEIPLGVLRFADYTLWVLEQPRGETGSFDLWRIDRRGARLILNADAGGC